MEEVRKDIPGYEGLYQVSSMGNIKSNNYKKSGKTGLMKLTLNISGYYYVLLSKLSKKYFVRVHRLVALAFIPNYKDKKEVNHKNGIKINNIVENLEWVTPSENMLHAIKQGIFKPNTIGLDKPKKCACVDLDGNILLQFDSIKLAAQHFDCTRGCINNCLLGRRKKIKGYRWIYV